MSSRSSSAPFTVAGLCALLAANGGAAEPPAEGSRAAQSAVVLPTATRDGVDPRAAAFIDAQLERALLARGLAVHGALRGAEALRQLGVSSAPSLADQWRVSSRLHADYAVHARLGAADGSYTLALTLACRDGRGPYSVRGDAEHGELGRTLSLLLAQLFEHVRPARVPQPLRAKPSRALPPAREAPSQPEPSSQPRDRGVRVASHNTLTLGTTEDSFLNLTLGGRLDYQWNDVVALGAGLAYANLEGELRRVRSVLTFVQLECRAALLETGLRVPLRLAFGYLQANGTVMRSSIGVTIPVTRRLELTLDVLAPTFYMTPDGVLPALSTGFEVALAL